jgi:hypothetical protein
MVLVQVVTVTILHKHYLLLHLVLHVDHSYGSVDFCATNLQKVPHVGTSGDFIVEAYLFSSRDSVQK